MLKIMGKKIFTVLCRNFLISKPVVKTSFLNVYKVPYHSVLIRVCELIELILYIIIKIYK